MTRKQIYWGLGITAGVAVLGLVIRHNRKKIVDLGNEIKEKGTEAAKNTIDKIQSWVRPVAAKISSPFGYRTHPITKVQQFHNGIDLPVPINTNIKNPMSGVVADVYSKGTGGNQLIIKHDNGFTTGYAHLTKSLVKKGDRVKQGEIIALSGNTGKVTGPHIHLTMKDKAGNWVDPAKVLYSIAA
jgi:murein DD-endopeptidase MepM/ murein hydrolase activator NlpD